MAKSLESRFERYTEVMIESLGHADRATPARWYLRGLMLPGECKSVEPMAARVHPQDVRSAHQSMHHLVADSEWSDKTLLSAVAGEVVPVLTKPDGQRVSGLLMTRAVASMASTRSVWRGSTAGSWARLTTARSQ